MQTLDFDTMNVGDVVLINTKSDWRNIAGLGSQTDAYNVMSIDVANRVAVLSHMDNGFSSLLVANEDGEMTRTPMSNNDSQTVEDVFQMSHADAVEFRLAERISAETRLSSLISSHRSFTSPHPVSKFIDDFFTKARFVDKGANTYVPDTATGYKVMGELLEGVRNLYTEESVKEAALLNSIIEESCKVYTQVVELIQSAGIDYTYSSEVTTLGARSLSNIDRTFRVGTSFMHEDMPYTISSVSATRAHVTDTTGDEVGYLSSSKADGLKLNIKKPSNETYYIAYHDCLPVPASSQSEMVKFKELEDEVVGMVTEHHYKMLDTISNSDCAYVRENARISTRTVWDVDTLPAAIFHIQGFVNAAQMLRSELVENAEDFIWKAERLIEKAYGK